MSGRLITWTLAFPKRNTAQLGKREPPLAQRPEATMHIDADASGAPRTRRGGRSIGVFGSTWTWARMSGTELWKPMPLSYRQIHCSLQGPAGQLSGVELLFNRAHLFVCPDTMLPPFVFFFNKEHQCSSRFHHFLNLLT